MLQGAVRHGCQALHMRLRACRGTCLQHAGADAGMRAALNGACCLLMEDSALWARMHVHTAVGAARVHARLAAAARHLESARSQEKVGDETGMEAMED